MSGHFSTPVPDLNFADADTVHTPAASEDPSGHLNTTSANFTHEAPSNT